MMSSWRMSTLRDRRNREGTACTAWSPPRRKYQMRISPSPCRRRSSTPSPPGTPCTSRCHQGRSTPRRTAAAGLDLCLDSSTQRRTRCTPRRPRWCSTLGRTPWGRRWAWRTSTRRGTSCSASSSPPRPAAWCLRGTARARRPQWHTCTLKDTLSTASSLSWRLLGTGLYRFRRKAARTRSRCPLHHTQNTPPPSTWWARTSQ